MKETNIQNAIRIALSPHGIVIRLQSGNFKLEDGRRIVCGVRGLSDLLFIGQGYCAFIETKTNKGKPSQDQLNFIEAVKRLGHIAGIARSPEEALKLIHKKVEVQ